MKVIDATKHKVGRLASYVAQDALKGETIRIVNADKAVFTGTRANILKKFKFKRKVGSRYQGPFYPKRADRIVKRVIRGMLPYKKQRGRAALDRIRAYIGVPEEFAKQKAVAVEGAKIGVMEKRLYLTVGELSKQLGAKVMEVGAPKEDKKVEGGKVEGSETPGAGAPKVESAKAGKPESAKQEPKAETKEEIK